MIDSAKPLAKFLKLRRVNIYDTIFILHSKCTTVILLIFSLLLSAKQYFGDPIRCMTDLKFPDFVHSYCWTFGTFVVPTNIADNRSTIAVGVGANAVERISLRYYQWVVILILVQAAVFYLPLYLWKIWENQRLEELCLPIASSILNADYIREHTIEVAKYFNSQSYTRCHRCYVFKYFTCEFLNLIISICNIIFLDFFLNGFWSRYFNTLSKVSLSNWEIWNYHTSQIFPKLGKCSIYTFGLGGSINNYDALCMLPLNILNEKVFIFLWFWFIFIINLAAVKIIYDLVLIFCLPLRVQLLRIRATRITYYQLHNILIRRSFADWFILYKMSLNVNPLFFTNLLIELGTSKSFRFEIFN